MVVDYSKKNSGKMEYSTVEGLRSSGAKEAAAATPQTKRGKLIEHIKLWWFWYLVAGVILAAILLPIGFKIIIPAIAQRIVDDRQVPIEYAELRALSKDEVMIALKAALSVPAGLSVGLDPIDLFLYNADTEGWKPFTSVPVPYMRLEGNTGINVESVKTSIIDFEELNKWLLRTFNQDTTMVNVKGHTQAHLGKLKFGIDLNKQIEIPALRRLEGVQLNEATIILPPEEDGTSIRGELTLPNWSELHVGLGNLSINVMADDVRVGLASVDDVFLKPGNNTLPFHGEIFLDTIVGNLFAVLQSQIDYLSKGQVHFGFTGNSSTVDGVHIDWLESVLGQTNLEVDVPLTQLAGDLVDSLMGGDIDLTNIFEIVQTVLPGLGGGGGDGGGGLLNNLLQNFMTNLDGMSGGAADLAREILGRVQDQGVIEKEVAKARSRLQTRTEEHGLLKGRSGQ